MEPLILAIDVGTSSCRTALFSETGARLVDTTAQQSYPLLTTSDGGAELEPTLLLRSVLECLGRTMALARADKNLRGRQVAAGGMSCFWHSLVGLDSKGEPLTNVITWADARCRGDAATLRELFSEKAVHQRTGCMLRSSFWPAKLVWFKRRHPSVFKRVKRWVSPAEWLQNELSGVFLNSTAMASGTGLFNPTKLDWDAALLEHCELDVEQLSPVQDIPFKLNASFASEFPELARMEFLPGIGDGVASNLGSGCSQPGYAAINVGTSAALRIMQAGKKAKAPTGLFCYRADSSRYLVGGAVSNAGNLREWCLKELNAGDPLALENALSLRPGPDHGLTVLPFWTAERAPTWNEELRGSVLGITQATTGLDMFQAITEATYQRIAQIADVLVEYTGEAPKFLVSGGIQRSEAALQRLADILDHPLYANPEPEASIRGAVVFAMEKLGIPVEPLPQTLPLHPRREIAERYREARLAQTKLEQMLKKHLPRVLSSD